MNSSQELFGKKILYDLTHMMSMVDIVAIHMDTLMIDSGYSMKKELIKRIHLNPEMVVYLTINQVDLCHGCVCGPLT